MADLLNVAVKFTVDKKEYEQGLNQVESESLSAGQRIGNGMKGIGSAVSGAIGGLAKITAAGITAATGAAVAITKQAISEYAEYEQLLGGVNKLYGTAGMSVEQYADSVGKSVDDVKDKYAELTKAQELVLSNAQNAYKTAGMSTTQYMETATSFSAALIGALEGDTVKAAEQTDVAMRAISDNYNTFGGDMANVENAFKGFAKQNYTMLDNLKLGYGGTKEEMARLIDDANEWAKANGQAADLSINSFSDVVTAIELIQEKQGIAGTTAREASTTISGSLGMVQSAWSNLVAGLADPDADISKLIDNVVKSIVGYTDEAGNHINGFLDNIIPAIKRATEGLVQLVAEAIPALAKELPSLLETTLPLLIQAGIDLFNGLIDALPTVMQVIFDQLPTIIEAIIDAVVKLLPMIIELGFTLLEALATGLLEALPDILPKITQLIQDLVAMFSDPEKLQNFINAAVEIITTLAQGLIEALPTLIPAVIDVILGIVEVLTEPDNLIMLIEASLQLILAIAEGLIKALPRLVEAAITIVENLLTVLVESLPLLLEYGGQLIDMIIDGIKNGFAPIMEAGKEIIDNVAQGISEKIEDAKQWGIDLINNFIGGIKEKWEDLKNTVSDVAGTIADFLGFSEPKEGPLSDFHTFAPDMMEAFASGITDNESLITNEIVKLGENVANIWKAMEDFIQNTMLNIQNNLALVWDAIKNLVLNLVDALKNGIVATFNVIKSFIETIWNAVMTITSTIWNGIKIFITTTSTNIKTIITTAFNAIKTLITSVWNAIVMLTTQTWTNIVTGIKNGVTNAITAVTDMATKIKDKFVELKNAAFDWGKDMIQNFVDGITDKMQALLDKVKSMADSIKSYIHFSVPDKGPLADADTYMPDMIDLFIKGIEDNQSRLFDTVQNAFNFKDAIVSPSLEMFGSGSSSVVGSNTYNINIYQPMKSASDVARAIREEQQYGLIGGGSLAY